MLAVNEYELQDSDVSKPGWAHGQTLGGVLGQGPFCRCEYLVKTPEKFRS